MSAPDRKLLIDFNNKIYALKNKTIENGCTQAEEDSALAKCEELIPKYNLNKSSLDYDSLGSMSVHESIDRGKIKINLLKNGGLSSLEGIKKNLNSFF